MAAHRYWRLLCRTNAGNGSFTGISELELRSAAGGATQTGSGTPLGSGSIQAGTLAAVFDGSTSTGVQWNGTGAGLFIGYDFGSGVTKDIVEINVLPRHDGANRTFGEFDVQSSDDNATWSTEWSCTYTAWVIGTTVTFTKPSAAAHRYWRVRPSLMVGTSDFGLAEMDMRTSIGGSDLCSGGTASARSTFSGLAASNAFANDGATTIWSSTSSLLGSEWLQYDFGAGNNKDIVEVWIQTRNDASWWQVPRAGVVESSPDGRSFLSRWSFADVCWGKNASSYIAKPSAVTPPGSGHRYWAIRCTASAHGTVFGLQEAEFRASFGGADETGSGIALTNDSFSGTVLPSAVFDNGSGEWSSAALPAIIAYDFGAGNEKSIVQTLMTARSSFLSNNTQAPTDFEILSADANGIWTAELTVAGQAGWADAETRLFPPAANRRRMSLM